MRQHLVIALFFFIASTVHGQAAGEYNLGRGLFVLKYNLPQEYNNKPVLLYSDSMCREVITTLTPEHTDCPTCMICAEPTEFNNGPIHTFICGANTGIALVCNRKTAKAYELFIDTTGQKAYAAINSKGRLYSWEAYMLLKAKQGDYFTFNRQWDSTVLYDKPYPINKLPPCDAHFFVNLPYNNIEDTRFYPVKINGY